MLIDNFQTSVVDSISYINVVANNICNITLKIFDVNGFIAKSFSTQIEKGAHLFNINLEDLKDGTYIINAFCGDTFLKSIKITKA